MKNYRFGDVVRAGVWGALLGTAAGFAVGMLIAPEEGRKIRRRLAFQLESLSQQIGRYIDQIVSSDGATNEARQKGDALVEDAKQRAEKIREDIDALLGEHRSRPPRKSSTTSG